MKQTSAEQLRITQDDEYYATTSGEGTHDVTKFAMATSPAAVPCGATDLVGASGGAAPPLSQLGAELGVVLLRLGASPLRRSPLGRWRRTLLDPQRRRQRRQLDDTTGAD